jgi:hypothetical protein
MKRKTNKDIAVFTFARGSQTHTDLITSDSYKFTLGIINTMMTRSGVDTPKVGIGGTKEDVCCFIAGLIQYQLLYNVEIKPFEGDISEFDPDLNTEAYDDEWG